MKVVWQPGETGNSFIDEHEKPLCKVMFALGLAAGLLIAVVALILQSWLLGAV